MFRGLCSTGRRAYECPPEVEFQPCSHWKMWLIQMLAKYIRTLSVSLIREEEDYFMEESDRGSLEFIASVQGLLRVTKCLGISTILHPGQSHRRAFPFFNSFLIFFDSNYILFIVSLSQ